MKVLNLGNPVANAILQAGLESMKITSNNGYYRLFDRQTGDYLHTGYNAGSVEELCEDYVGYISNDAEANSYKKLLSERNYAEILNLIKANEFEIELSPQRFPEQED